METQIIELYCIIEDFLKAINFKDDSQAKMSSAEIMTVVIFAGWYFGANHEKSRRFFKDYLDSTLKCIMCIHCRDA